MIFLKKLFKIIFDVSLIINIALYIVIIISQIIPHIDFPGRLSEQLGILLVFMLLALIIGVAIMLFSGFFYFLIKRLLAQKSVLVIKNNKISINIILIIAFLIIIFSTIYFLSFQLK